jgi:signal transduction histidine kinase
LEAALTLQRRFVADAGHELRTPLTLLSTRAQMLRRRLRSASGADLRSDVDGIVSDAERLAAILDDLLLAADPRAGATEPIDVTTVVAEVTAGAAPSAQQAGVTITAQLDTERATVLGSPGGLRRAVTALADNAVRHAAGEVVVAVSATAALVVVTVTDDGPGIDTAMLPQVFERFSSTGRAGGVGPRRYGLGLALVSEVVTRHGGTVTAANAPGRGAVVRIELPRFQGTSQD